MDCIAIIPARGGSKRIPKKNIVDFCGKPMIAWTIEAAIKTGIFKRVLVSTDDAKIADISLKYGAEVPFLRQNNADDYTPVSLATLDSLNQMEKYYNEEYLTVVQLMANTPLRNADDIIRQCEFFKTKNTSSVISCTKFMWMNPWWAAKLDDNNRPKMLFEEELKRRSQDLEELYCPTGAIWISKTSSLKEHKTFYSPDHLFYPLDWKNAIDIDTIEDLDFAKTVSCYQKFI